MFYATGSTFRARGYPPDPAWPYGTPAYRGEFTPESEMEALKAQANYFQKQIDVLNERIRELGDIASSKKGE